jgi:hypothetical protein
MIWWVWLGICLPAIGLAAGFYRFGSLSWEPLGLGVFLALLLAGFDILRLRLAPDSGGRLLWGSLAGGAAWIFISAMLAPFSGLTWMLVAPYHHTAILLVCMLLATVLMPKNWPPEQPIKSTAGWRLLLLLGLGGVMILAGLAMGIKALSLDSAAPQVQGIKGLIKNPSLLLLCFGLAGCGLCGLARMRPAWLIFKLIPVLAYGLLWAGVGLDISSAMTPLVESVSVEVLQLMFLLSAFSLGLRLSLPARQKSLNPSTSQ